MAQLDSPNDGCARLLCPNSLKNKKSGYRNITLRVTPALALFGIASLAYFGGWEIPINTFGWMFSLVFVLAFLWEWFVKNGGIVVSVMVVWVLIGAFGATQIPDFFVDREGKLVHAVNDRVDTFATIKELNLQAIGKKRPPMSIYFSYRFSAPSGSMVCINAVGNYPFEKLPVGAIVPLTDDGKNFKPLVQAGANVRNASVSVGAIFGTKVPGQADQALRELVKGIFEAQGVTLTGLSYAVVPPEQVLGTGAIPSCVDLLAYDKTPRYPMTD